MHRHRDAVELRERLGPQNRLGRTRRDAVSAVQQRETIAVEPGESEIVHGRQHGEPVLTPQAIDEFEGLLLMADVECAGRFVQQENRSLLGQCTGDDEALTLATRERSETTVGELRQVETFENVAHDGSVVSSLGTEIRDVRITSEKHVLEAAHVVRQHRRLGHVSHQCGAASTRPQIERAAVDEYPSFVANQTGDRVQHRRLSGPVRSDETQPLARLDRVGERLKGHVVAVAHTEIDERERTHRRAS